MKFIKQLVIILTITFLGELTKKIIPISIPASIYGLIFMFLALKFNIISLELVRDTGKFLIEIVNTCENLGFVKTS